MGPKLDDELFSKLVKLFIRGFQVASLSQIHWSDLAFELQCTKHGNSNIQLET